MEGLVLAHQRPDLPIIVQIDCANVLLAVKEAKRNTSMYGHLYEEVKHLISICEVKFVKITRDQNKVLNSQL
jgi:hypothetical protein